MKYLIFLFLFAPFVSSLEVEFDCPSKVNVGEEFECSFEIIDSEEIYDVKVDITKEGSSVARIYDSSKNDWKSAYYYLNEFSEDAISLKITEEGEYDGKLKLRKESSREEYPFEIDVVGEVIFESSEEDEEIEEENNLKDERDIRVLEESREEIVVDKEKPREVILLNSPSTQTIEEDRELIYESKESRKSKYLPYAFSLFLIGIIVFLLWEKF